MWASAWWWRWRLHRLECGSIWLKGDEFIALCGQPWFVFGGMHRHASAVLRPPYLNRFAVAFLFRPSDSLCTAIRICSRNYLAQRCFATERPGLLLVRHVRTLAACMRLNLCLMQVHKVTKLQRLQNQRFPGGAKAADTAPWLESLRRNGVDTDKIVESHYAHQECLKRFVLGCPFLCCVVCFEIVPLMTFAA